MTRSASHPEPVTLAITGASGFQYAFRLLQVLVSQKVPVYLLVSKAAHVVAATETDLKLPGQAQQLQKTLCQMLGISEELLKVFGREDWMSPVASGSGSPGRMVVCPCSTGTLSSIANGSSNDLIERAADVVLKEGKKLILVPRESPYSAIHLENMLKLARLGVVILPASPGFYQKPATVEDMVDFVVARILMQLDIPQKLLPPWGRDDNFEKPAEESE